MGLGLLGRGVGDAAFLAKHGVDLLVTDLKPKKELAPSIKKLKSYKLKATSYVLGKHRLEDFKNRDFILKAAGVPLDSPYIAEARKNKIPIEMDAPLFFKLMLKGATFIGVTGTRGKTTTAYLIYEILKSKLVQKLQMSDVCNYRHLTSVKRKVFLAGNIKDTATLPLLEKVKENDFIVAELDSWQLQGFGDSKISPHISVFTTFYSDHMGYYQGSMEKYFEDKENIFRYQKKNDVLVVGSQAWESVKKTKPISKTVVAKTDDLPYEWRLKIPGEHNRANAACALAVARALKIPDEISRKAIENFGGVPGRLEFVREINGVKIYNDTCATTPDATIAALEALNQVRLDGTSNLTWKNKIVLIMGGSDKGLDMSNLVEEIPKFCKAVFLLPGSGSEKLQATSYQLQPNLINVSNLEEAVEESTKAANRGDTILFSPAFASFGMFKNEYDRGEQFNKIVKKLA